MYGIESALLERFLHYVKTWSSSNDENAEAGIMPSTPQQMDFAKNLVQELHQLGIANASVNENAYIIAHIEATKGYEKTPVIGFLAHMDTIPEVCGKNVKPQVHTQYDGSIIRLSDNVSLDPASDIYLKNSIGDTVITTDGTTLLGADDKAGIAEIMSALSIWKAHPEIPHGAIDIIFSPDEETGHGMDKVPLKNIKAEYCYTLDGGNIGELETECFTAYKAEITFTGKSKHTGTARPDMINAITMLTSFMNMLPQNESPEATDGYQGFYAPMNIEGVIERAKAVIFLRDFSDEGMQRRIDAVHSFAKAVEARFPTGIAAVHIVKQYVNMKEKLAQKPLVTELLIQATKNLGITAVFKPIRGGTDGSRLSEMGIPTPNVFTGGHNYHSRSEWAALSQMVCAVELIIELAKLWTQK